MDLTITVDLGPAQRRFLMRGGAELGVSPQEAARRLLVGAIDAAMMFEQLNKTLSGDE